MLVPPEIVIYTTPFCFYCVRAKQLLGKKGVVFCEVDVSGDDAARERLREQTGVRRVPQIFINGAFIGGHYELAAMDRDGELDRLLETPR
ncbi:MAG TPA: glutaredoxin domain-containing protein [Polyangiaceae bacterium]|nr:glutaredoxin domain-containing protein [Polyangiaceae bacterium]